MSRIADLQERTAMHALHGLARMALRLQSPLQARRTIATAGSMLRPFANVHEARGAARAIEGTGTCLSRSLAVAARLPGSDVVIGVDPRRSKGLRAHAWVEFRGELVDGATHLTDVESRREEPIARL